MKVCEIFRSIQGESYMAGLVCTFVRLSGCNLSCPWCDTKYALGDENATEMSIMEVFDRVWQLGADLVEVTGGEPLLQEESLELVRMLCDSGAKVLVETNGTLDISKVDPRASVIMDLKAPSSGHVEQNRWSNVDLLAENDEIKVVVADRGDYEWAVSELKERGIVGKVRITFSAVWGSVEHCVLAQWLIEDGLPIKLGVQLHKVIWGPDARGV